MSRYTRDRTISLLKARVGASLSFSFGKTPHKKLKCQKETCQGKTTFTIDYYDYNVIIIIIIIIIITIIIHLLFYRAHIDSSCITEVVTLYKYFSLLLLYRASSNTC